MLKKNCSFSYIKKKKKIHHHTLQRIANISVEEKAYCNIYCLTYKIYYKTSFDFIFASIRLFIQVEFIFSKYTFYIIYFFMLVTCIKTA